MLSFEMCCLVVKLNDSFSAEPESYREEKLDVYISQGLTFKMKTAVIHELVMEMIYLFFKLNFSG